MGDQQLTVALQVIRERAAATGARPDRTGWTLTAQAVLAACAVALASVLVTALVAVPLATRAAERRAQESLRDQARLAAEVLRPRIDSPGPGDERRLLRAINAFGLEAYLVRDGRAHRPGLPPEVVDSVAAGRDVSDRLVVAGRLSLVEGRALGGGDGVVLTQRRADGVVREVAGGLWLPLLAGLAAGVVAGVLAARRLARPIRNAAIAAGRLRSGDRGVRVPVEQPREAAELADALNDLAGALATSEARQREFLLSVSHELRTPLTTIRGYAEALADGVVGADGAAGAGRTVLGEAEHLDRLVSDLLTLARLDAVDFALTPLPVDLVRVVADAAQAWRPRCAAAGADLRTELPAAPVPAYTDPGRIRQVVDVLVENALRVVPAGAPLVLAVRAVDGSAVAEIRDGGPGLTDDDLAVAFQQGALHRRYREVRQVGTGLGLALAAGLVRRLGGSIEAGHAPEGGARFTVRLPSAPPFT